MNITKKILVNILATLAFISLFLLPVIAFSASKTQAGATEESVSGSGDYVFFIVENEEVPLAALPSANASSYILWVGLAAFAITMMFVYFAWYLSIRRNVRELCRKLTPAERRAFLISRGYLHPIRSYQLAREAEDTVASMFVKYI